MSLSPKFTGRTMSYTPAYANAYPHSADVEKVLSSPTRLAKRLLVTRKARSLIGTLILGGVLLYFVDFGPAPGLLRIGDGANGGGAGADGDEGWRVPEEWMGEGEEYDEDAEQGWEKFAPVAKPIADKVKPKPIDGTAEYIVDENGDHFVTGWVQPIAPMHPDVSLLTPAKDLMSEIDLSSVTPPVSLPFPDSRLGEILSASTEGHFQREAGNKMPSDAWSQQWRAPTVWDGPKAKLRKVQWKGFAGGRSAWESEEEKGVREERREAVKRGFKHAWDAYKRHAWGHDEVKPVSQSTSDPFNGWGATIVDSLDTLLLMGFSDEYNQCRPHVNQLNYHWVNGRDWSQGYVGEKDDKGDSYVMARDKNVALPIFETGIRYLGGLLGAYDLSGDQLLVDRAVDLATVLAKAFNTESGLPGGRVDPGSADEYFRLSTVSIAEVGSMSLEMIRLSQVTGDRKWFDLAQRAMDYLEARVIPRGVHQPLIPMWFTPSSPMNQQMIGGITFGGLADSYYEYLIKTYKLLGGTDVAQSWKDIYSRSIDKAKDLLYVNVDIVPDHDLLAIGKLDGGRLIPELEHLSCFAGAMLGLGAKLLDRPDDLVDAERVTATCYWLSADTPTGLQPEVMEWFDPLRMNLQQAYDNVSVSSGRPLINIVAGQAIPGTYQDIGGVTRWSDDQTEVDMSEVNSGEPRRYAKKLKGTPTGALKVSGRGINRPETIESIFYMYRLTGDRKWQEKGWKMFVSWMETAKVDGGISSVADVTKPRDQVIYTDNMESFALAETFKYHFLLQSEPDVLSLDDYVLNTEAHPFLVNPSLDPKIAHVKYWTPLPDQELGARGQGTDVQKYHRLEVISHATAPMRGPPAGAKQGGGKGMGGGGGRPGGSPNVPPPVAKVKQQDGSEYPDDF